MEARITAHPTEQTLGDFSLGKLTDAEAKSINDHLEGCAECRQQVAEMSPDSFLGRLQDAHQGTATIDRPSGPPPELAEHPDYQIIRELGRGGMGVVYLAHNRLMARDEVLKVVGGHLIERKGVLDRFLREIRSAARLGHPNIVQAYSAFRVGPTVAFAMEYVEGLDLAKLVGSKGPLPVAHACFFVSQAAMGLQHAHERGMVHRDIKPGNLMLSRKGEKAVVKVLDFGLAKATLENTFDGSLTNEGQMLGTPDFIAPEQIRDAQSADVRADIYSLGCTLYYLLTGKPPFQAALLYDLLQAHFSMDAQPLNLARPGVPAELAALVAKMMAKEPGRRFQTPGEVAQALAPFFKKGGAVAATAKLSTTDRPTPRRVETVAEPKRPPATKGPWDDLIDTVDADRSLSLAEPLARRVASRPPKPPRWAWPAAGLILFGCLIALGVFIIRIKSKDGEVVLRDPPPGTKVNVGPGKVDVVVGGEPQPEAPPAKEPETAKLPRGKPAESPSAANSAATEETKPVPPGPKPASKPGTRKAAPSWPSTADRIAKLTAALEMPIPMNYPKGVTIRQFVADLQKATRGPDGLGIPIYVDPWGLHEADKSMDSMIVIRMQGVALRKTLPRALQPLSLEYRAEEGLLYIGASFHFQEGLKTQTVVNADETAESKAVLEALEEPLPIKYARETPLKDVVEDLRKVLKERVGPGFDIHVDPIGLQEADKTEEMPVTIDLEGVPLRVSLRWLLSQLGLNYFVEDGLMTITDGPGAAKPLK